MSSDILVRAQGLSKKFSRDLKKSLWYGVTDTLSDLVGRGGATDQLRPSEFWALNNISFDLRPGECLGLIGRNGAGKTTLLKLLSGLIKPDNGRVEIKGRLGALIALGAGFNAVLTGRENVYVNAAVLGLSRREINEKIGKIIDFAELGEFIDAPVQSYSSGMVVRLGFAVAAATDPDVLLLDEVLAVGDAGFQTKCLNTLAEFRKRGTGFIFVSHNMHMIARYCQKVMYVRHGRVQHFGDVDTGIAQYFKDMHASGFAEEADIPGRPGMVGSGKIRIASMRFLNAKNEAVSEIDVGESITLAIQYERNDAGIENTVLDLTIRDPEGVVFQGTNGGNPFANLASRGELTVRFEYLPVNTSFLDFFIVFMDQATGEVHDWKRRVRLNVRHSPRHSGRLVLPTTWAVTPNEAPDAPRLVSIEHK
jgi:homopolymeric O-antigen transport system ATP-binding protein